MTDDRERIIEHRLSRAHEAFESATQLYEAQHFDAAVYFLYHACFYAVSALLYSYDLSVSTHPGVQKLLLQHFVRPGCIGIEYGTFFSTMFHLHQQSCYKDFYRVDPSVVYPLFAQARAFVAEIERVIKESPTEQS